MNFHIFSFSVGSSRSSLGVPNVDQDQWSLFNEKIAPKIREQQQPWILAPCHVIENKPVKSIISASRPPLADIIGRTNCPVDELCKRIDISALPLPPLNEKSRSRSCSGESESSSEIYEIRLGCANFFWKILFDMFWKFVGKFCSTCFGNLLENILEICWKFFWKFVGKLYLEICWKIFLENFVGNVLETFFGKFV